MPESEEKYIHGWTESRALTRAAQGLSAARAYRDKVLKLIEAGHPDYAIMYRTQYGDAAQRVRNAQANYDAAYVRYTNPFGERKVAY